MPSYEFFFTVKRLSKPELVDCLKRVGTALLAKSGVLRKIEYLGTRTFPYKISKSGAKSPDCHDSGSYFLYHVDLPPAELALLKKNFKLDFDLLRVSFHLKHTPMPLDYECTLPEEMLPPSYRKSVQELIEQGRIAKQRHDLGKDGEKW